MTIKLKNIKFPKTYSELLQWVCYLWAGTICFPALQGTFYGVFVLLLWGIFRGHIGFSFKNKDNKKSTLGGFRGRKMPFYFLLAYLLWMTATIFWSDDIREYFRQFEKLIPLYLLAFIGFMDGVKKHIDFNKILNAFLWGVLAAVAYMVIRMGVDMFVGDTIGRIKTAGIMSLDLLTSINHRTYIGATLLMAIPLLVMNIKSQSRWQQVSTIIFVLFIDLLCIMSSARILMGLSVLVTLYACYYVWGKQVKWWIQLVVFSVVLSGSLVLVLQNQRIQSKIAQIQQGADIEDVESRTYLWKCATELIKEKPLCGYGMGDAKGALLDKYAEYGYKEAKVRELNAHNQYLQIALYGGIIPLAFFFLFFISLLSQSNKIQPLGITFILVFGIILAVESVLVRNIGVMPMILFVMMIINYESRSDSESLNKSFVLTFIFFWVVYLYAYYIPMNAAKPNTLFTGEYKIVSFSDLPENDKLPCKGFGLLYDLDKITLKKYTNVNYINDDMMILDLDEKSSTKIHISVWCYVPSGNDMETVAISIYDGVKGFNSKYDLSKSDTWQKLEININENLSRTRLYIMVDSPKNSDNNLNKVFYHYPKLTVNNKKII